MNTMTRPLHFLSRFPSHWAFARRRATGRASLFALLLALPFAIRLAGAAIPASPQPLTLRWTLVPKSCTTVESPNPPLTCGEYGTFYFGAVSTGSCPVIAYNTGEIQKSYAKSILTKPFIHNGRPKLQSWVAVIDTAGEHARSVAYLVSELAGPEVGVQAMSVDDPALTPMLGPIPTDFHVIGQLCSVLNEIEGLTATSQPPLVINLSIGRKLESGDPADDTSCDPNTASCQLAKLLARAKADGSTIVAALGNQRDRMWPASLGSVIGAGQLSARQLLASGAVVPAWENPPGLTRALFVGNSLCLADWPAPAGSSYSAATASGLIAQARVHVAGFDPYVSGILAPMRDDASGKWGLARNGLMVGEPSAVLTGLYDDLASGSCWNGGPNQADATEGHWVPGYAPRIPVPFPTWTSATFNPLPVEDPCTPCVAFDTGLLWGGDDLTVNLSQASPLPSSKHIDAAHLRVGNSFYALNLSRDTRIQLRDATLHELVLPGMASHLQSVDASIMFTILYAPGTSPNPPDPDQGYVCPSLPAGSCYWISIPVFLQP